MTPRALRSRLPIFFAVVLLSLGTPAGPARGQDPAPAATPASSGSGAPTVAPLTSDQLDALVAPIALYPDSLVAQVLGAAMNPDQIAIADYFVTQNKNLTGDALAQAVDQQDWDPSVKALTQFPDVLHDLATNLVWTSNLGQAFHEQQSDVMAAVQAMRAKAQAAGTLQSTAQATVTQPAPQTIVIQPANPQVVYVPRYNPAVVYGAPYVVPFYTPPVAVAAATVSWGAGFSVSAGFSWGFGAWGCNWGGGGGGGNTIIYNHNTYINNRSWHNTYNNYHPWGPGPHGDGPYGPHRYDPGNRNQPNGGRNGDHGLIGGQGGTQHLLGGPGGTERQPGTQQRQPGVRRAGMSGDGTSARAESNRGRQSLHPGAPRPRPQRQQRPQNRPRPQARPHPPARGGHRG